MDIDKLINSREPVYFTFYTIGSSLNYGDPSRYCQKIEGEIRKNKSNDAFSQFEVVGKLEAYKILVGLAINNKISLSDVFDSYQVTMDIGSEILDFEQADFNKAINEKYNYDSLGSDVLILSRIEILPEYRGRYIGKRAIKDLCNNFISGCGLFALKCSPIQHEFNIGANDDPFTKSMHYEELEKNERKAYKKLSEYYSSMGLEFVSGIDPRVRVYNPANINEELDGIILDDE